MSVQLAFFHGMGEKNRILAAMQANHSIYLNALRSFAREHALRHGEVSIDDVRDMISQRDFPMPREIGMKDDRVFGTVFLSSEFKPIRHEQTRRADFKARVGVARSFITVYRLREMEAA